MQTQTLESSLVYQKEDGQPAFVHDTYRDFFLAKYYAQKINSGEISVEDAYADWSYREDPSFWGLSKRTKMSIFLPEHSSLAASVAELLDREKSAEFARLMLDNYKPSIADFRFNMDCLLIAAKCYDRIDDKKLKGNILKKLREGTKSDYSSVRSAAMVGLVNVKDPVAEEEIIKLLMSGRTDDGRTAAEALQTRATGKSVGYLVASYIRNEDDCVLEEQISKVLNRPDLKEMAKKEFEKMFYILRDDKKGKYFAHRCLRGLGELGATEHRELFNRMLLLGGEDMKCEAAKAFAELKAVDTYDIILSELQPDFYRESMFFLYAAYSLEWLNPERFLSDASRLIKIQENTDIAAEAIHLLEPLKEKAIPVLIPLLGEKEEIIRKNAYEVLFGILNGIDYSFNIKGNVVEIVPPTNELMQELLVLASSPGRDIRKDAINTLKGIKPEYLELYKDAILDHSRKEVRSIGLRILEEPQTPNQPGIYSRREPDNRSAGELVREAIYDLSYNKMDSATEYLKRFDRPEVRQTIREELDLVGKPAKYVSGISLVLGEFGDESDVPLLVNLLESKPDYRTLEALGKIGGKVSVSAIHDFLRRPPPKEDEMIGADMILQCFIGGMSKQEVRTDHAYKALSNILKSRQQDLRQ